MSIADSAWLLNVEFAASLVLHVAIEVVFAGLAITIIRARRPRGGLLLFAAVLIGLMLTIATTIAYPIAFRLVDTVFGVDNIIFVQVGLHVTSSLAGAFARVMQIGAVVAVAMDPGPSGDLDDPSPL